jgi:membrane protease YdiL (CAAX protease family)
MNKSLQSLNRHYFLTAGVVLLIAFTVMRGLGMLGSIFAQPLLPLSFVLMAVIPFILLSRTDRTTIGLKRCTSYQSYMVALILGSMAAWICYIIGTSLFHLSNDNWYVTIKNFYLNNPAYNSATPLWQTFLIFTVPALIFSPIGEEIFFRGFFQESLKLNFTERTSTLIECTCFGIIHLFHHGLVVYNSNVIFVPFSGVIWAALMASVAFMLVQIRKDSQSLYPAMVCHASFNLSMNTIIFFLV